MKKNYHSSLKNEEYTSSGVSHFTKGKNSTFVMDIVTDISKAIEIKGYDLIYSEPAWQSGYTKFQERANKNDSDYNAYIESIIKLLLSTTSPVVLILGKHVIKKFPQYQSNIQITLHGYKTNAYGWNIDLIKYNKSKTNYDLIELLAKDYSFVWDFNCGYGNTGKIFLDNNKSCILSDLNEKCVTYIAENIL